MRKAVRLTSTLTVIMLLFTLCSCLKFHDSITPRDITFKMCDIDRSVTYVEVTEGKIQSFFNISPDMLKGYSVFIANTENSTNTVAVFQIEHDDDKAVVLDALNKYVTSLSDTFRLSNESEFSKLQSRVIMELDDCIVLMVSDNVENMKEAFIKMVGRAVK